MRDFTIVTDGCCDLSKEMVQRLNVKVVPLTFTLNDKTYKHYHDFREMNAQTFYKSLREGALGTTAATNIADITDVMSGELNEGRDVLYLSFSSGLSGSYQSAVLAADDLKDEFPEATIQVVDTLSVSVGLGMLVYMAAMLKEKQHDIHQVAEYVQQHARNICHHFIVDDLKFLYRGGRLSATEAALGSILNVKPLLKISEEGKVAVAGKVRGSKAAMRQMVEQATKNSNNHDVFFISHANAEADANALADKIKEQYPDAEIYISWIGPVLGTHVGPGTLALIFSGSER